MNAFGMDLAQWLWLLSSIITVESNGKVDAVGDGGKAIGILQIHACVIVDVNRVHGTSYSLDDRKNPDKSLDIAYLYLSHWGKSYHRKTGKAPTTETLSRIWNGGPNGWKKEATVKYWNKVNKQLLATK